MTTSRLPNTGSSSINNWTLKFDFPVRVTSIWGATIVSHTGSQYVIMNAAYNGTIAPGQSVSFGVLGKPGRALTGPTTLVLNGVPLRLSPDAPAPVATMTFMVTGQSKNGDTATVTITNMGTVPIGGWALQFKFSPKITLMNNAAIVRHEVQLSAIRDAGADRV